MKRLFVIMLVMLLSSATVALAGHAVGAAGPKTGDTVSVGKKRAVKKLCVNKRTRIVRVKQQCRHGERRVRWNRRARGPHGPAGQPGMAGVPGYPGGPGAPGETGEQGERGPQGEKGDAGERGTQGDPGERGLQGEKGDAGERGAQGEKGETGERGAVGVTDVAFLALLWEDDPWVTLDADTGLLTFGIPRGRPGEQGPAGPQGAPGPQGPQGNPGPQGEKGDPGPQGPQGPQGPAGVEGAVTTPGVGVSEVNASAGKTGTAKAACPAGKVLISGGYEITGDVTSATVSASHPSTTEPHTWVAAYVTTRANANVTLTAFVICA